MPTTNQRIGEYVLIDRIGQGAFGEVWLARHHAWADQQVAVKVPTDPQFIRNLQREGSAVHGLRHPNIVRAINFDPYADPPYFVMEYVPGKSLRQLIDTMEGGRTMRPEDASAVMRQVLLALRHAHQNGLVHRDIKPENILIHEKALKEGFGGDGTVKLTDFGLGKAALASAGSVMLSMETAEGRKLAGTHQYMAPEQFEAQGSAQNAVDGRADLYSCGVVLFEMLTGRRPAGTDVPSDLNPAVPKHLDEAFRRSYARLDRRFKSADEFLAVLDAGASAATSAATTTAAGATGPRTHGPPPTTTSHTSASSTAVAAPPLRPGDSPLLAKKSGPRRALFVAAFCVVLLVVMTIIISSNRPGHGPGAAITHGGGARLSPSPDDAWQWLEHAEANAARINWGQQKAAAYRDLAGIHVLSGDIAAAQRVFERARQEYSGSPETVNVHPDAPHLRARQQAESGDVTGAMQTAWAIPSPLERAYAYRAIAAAQNRAGKREELIKWVETLTDPLDRTYACLGAAEGLLPRGEVPAAGTAKGK